MELISSVRESEEAYNVSREVASTLDPCKNVRTGHSCLPNNDVVQSHVERFDGSALIQDSSCSLRTSVKTSDFSLRLIAEGKDINRRGRKGWRRGPQRKLN